MEIPKEEIFDMFTTGKIPPTITGMFGNINKDCCITADFYLTAAEVILGLTVSFTPFPGWTINLVDYRLTLIKPLFSFCFHVFEAGPNICLNIDSKC